MSTDNNTGGAAFPTYHDRDPFRGMTLRDYFAAKAMQTVNENFAPNHDENDKDWSQWVARISYQLADAMLKAREA